MSKLQKDFLGPFVECNGAVNRPSMPTELSLEGKLVAKHILYTERVRVTDEAGRQEEWFNCGNAVAYREARNTLNEKQFKNFAAMACGPSLAGMRAAQELYPQMHALYPKGHVDYLSASYRAHSEQEKQLQETVYARRALEYKAKMGNQAPAKVDAPIKVIKATSIDEVMARITGKKAARRGPGP